MPSVSDLGWSSSVCHHTHRAQGRGLSRFWQPLKIVPSDDHAGEQMRQEWEREGKGGSEVEQEAHRDAARRGSRRSSNSYKRGRGTSKSESHQSQDSDDDSQGGRVSIVPN